MLNSQTLLLNCQTSVCVFEGPGGRGLGGYMSCNPVEPSHYDFPSYGPSLYMVAALEEVYKSVD